MAIVHHELLQIAADGARINSRAPAVAIDRAVLCGSRVTCDDVGYSQRIIKRRNLYQSNT